MKVQKVHARGPDKCLMTSTGSIGGEKARTHRNFEKSSGLSVKGERKWELIEISVKPHCLSQPSGNCDFCFTPTFQDFSAFLSMKNST